MLQETAEEWEQCERKMKDVRTWIEKTKGTLDSAQHKKKSLRDQLGLAEKFLADISIQKTKITMSVEKLQVIEIFYSLIYFNDFALGLLNIINSKLNKTF